MGSRCRRYSSAFEQLAWELPGAVEAGDVPVFCHHQCPLWRHPGECGFPASVPAEFGRSSCCRAQFLHYRPVLSVQGKRLVQSISIHVLSWIFFFRIMSCSSSAALTCNARTISNCKAVRSAPATRKLNNIFCRPSRSSAFPRNCSFCCSSFDHNFS